MIRLSRLVLFSATFLVTAGMVLPAAAATAPADPCSLLRADEVSEAVGRAYNSPEKSVAPRPYANSVMGTDCNYHPQGNGSGLWFRVYFDPSPAAATDLFAKLKRFYSPPTPVPGLGDEAYFDPKFGLHIRKGNVRFFLSFKDMDTVAPADQKQLKDLASVVCGRL